MKEKTPKYLKPKDVLTFTQRKSCGLQKVPPRVREEGEATPRMICNASIKEHYKVGMGDNAWQRSL